MNEKKDLTSYYATDLLGSFSFGMAVAIKTKTSYEGFASFIQQRYILTPAQWGFLVGLWELTTAASVEIHIEKLNQN
jgi:hypothetical protein